MIDTITLIQELKRYLHETTPNFDDSIDVKFSDFSEEYDVVFHALITLQNENYLKIIGVMGAPGAHLESKFFDVREFKRKYPPEYAKVILAENFGEIDEKFELKWKASNREVWAGKMFIKGFRPTGGAFMNAFVYSYNNSGEVLGCKDFKYVLATNKEIRLDTVMTTALDTLSRDSVKFWFPILGSKKIRCEPIYWKSDEEHFALKKEPKHYEWDSFERGEWSDD